MKTYGHFIGGKHVPGTSGSFGDVYWPGSAGPSTMVQVLAEGPLMIHSIVLM